MPTLETRPDETRPPLRPDAEQASCPFCRNHGERSSEHHERCLCQFFDRICIDDFSPLTYAGKVSDR